VSRGEQRLSLSDPHVPVARAILVHSGCFIALAMATAAASRAALNLQYYGGASRVSVDHLLIGVLEPLGRLLLEAQAVRLRLLEEAGGPGTGEGRCDILFCWRHSHIIEVDVEMRGAVEGAGDPLQLRFLGGASLAAAADAAIL